ncbi:hypothetical protein [Gimesia panareensis]|uniref:hypothetical protein n=1 Tax=Gimesia panareensis TaxID=2527978 RepID=UPI0011A51B10|nr:hypothetical protein [Gimesia panareensis]
MLEFDGNVIVAKSVSGADCVVIDPLRFDSQQHTFFYSFKLIGDLKTSSCSVLRLHNFLPNQGTETVSTHVPFLNIYCRSEYLCIAIHEFEYPAAWCPASQSYALKPFFEQGHQLCPIKGDHWVDLEIELKWSQENICSIRCNDLTFSNVRTNFHHCPYELCVGIMSGTEQMQSVIRTYEFRHESISRFKHHDQSQENEL